MCLIFNSIVRAQVAKSSISRDRDSRPSSNFDGKSMVWGAVGSNDLALWWSQWLIQVLFTFIYQLQPPTSGQPVWTNTHNNLPPSLKVRPLSCSYQASKWVKLLMSISIPRWQLFPLQQLFPNHFLMLLTNCRSQISQRRATCLEWISELDNQHGKSGWRATRTAIHPPTCIGYHSLSINSRRECEDYEWYYTFMMYYCNNFW